MSAFMVRDKTINRIIGWLNNSDNRWDLHAILKAAEICNQDNASLPCPSDWHERLGASMFQMNADAVNARYGARQAEEFRPLDYQFHWELPAHDAQVVKHLGCWLYQCSEGDIPERELYRAFDALKGRIACNIVSRTPAYEAAAWE